MPAGNVQHQGYQEPDPDSPGQRMQTWTDTGEKALLPESNFLHERYPKQKEGRLRSLRRLGDFSRSKRHLNHSSTA